MQDESRAVLTGKGVGYGGSVLRSEATGYGAVLFAESMLRWRENSLEGKTCVVSGSGNVALYAAEKLLANGCLGVIEGANLAAFKRAADAMLSMGLG